MSPPHTARAGARRSSRPHGLVLSALLKHWRGVRGMSQLDLAHAADVSARHISFIETGRSKPSRDMVLRLCGTLDVPLREQNTLLHAAGYAPQFAEEDHTARPTGAIRDALERMMAQQEPYPLMVLNRGYDVLMMNAAATRFLGHLGGLHAGPGPSETNEAREASETGAPLNAIDAVFNPAGLRPMISNWDEVAYTLLARLHREALHRPGDDVVGHLISRVLSYPDVPADWRARDLSTPSSPLVNIWLDVGGARLGFFTTMTVFQAPQNVALEETIIESYFPLDDATAALCQAMASG